jgi:putative transposase
LNRAYKFRIYPNKKQQHQFYKEFSASKFVYNYYLDKTIKYYEENKNNEKKSLNFYDWCRDLTIIKKEENNLWLNEVASQNLIQSLRDLDSAYKNFFRNVKKGMVPGFPNFKKFNSSIRYHNQSCKYIRDHHKIKLSKIGKIKIIDYTPAYGKLMNMTISKERDGKWFASICVEQKDDIIVPDKQEKQIGIDVGIKSFLVDSDGNKIDNPKFLEKSEKALKKEQRLLSKKKIGSNNRKKQRLILAKKHSRIANQRKNFLNQLSTKMTRDNTMIAHEDLVVKNMVRNHKLAKSISSVSWSEFFRMLDYKGGWNNCKIIKIGKFEPSSKTCNNCGFVLKELGLEAREWECPNCHNILDRDINAAKNILEIGLKNCEPICET